MIKQLSFFKKTVEKSAHDYKPNLIANYCFELAKSFSSFYAKCKVIGSKEEAKRVLIVKKYLETLERALSLLGIEIPEMM